MRDLAFYGTPFDNTPGNVKLIGEYFHALQDTYSHSVGMDRFNYIENPDMLTPALRKNLGHAHLGHQPDWTWKDKDKAMAMAEMVYNDLAALAKHLGSSGTVTPWAQIKGTVSDFVGYKPTTYHGPAAGIFGELENVTFEGYTRKIRILDPSFTISQRYLEMYWPAKKAAPYMNPVKTRYMMPAKGGVSLRR